MSDSDKTRRVVALLIAAMGWYALGLQLFLEIQSFADRGEGVGAAVWRFLVYFTNLTNLLVALVMSARAMGGRLAPGRSVLTGAAVNITMVGLIYHFLLSWQWHPQGWQLLADILLHYAAPTSMALYWLTLTTKGGLNWRDTLLWLSFPLAYLVYALARGPLDGFYAYYFLDPPKLGLVRTMVNAVGLIVPFAIMCGIYLFCDARLAKRSA